MLRSPIVRWSLGFLCFIAAVTALHLKPWGRLTPDRIRAVLQVGFLPVT